MPGLMARFMLVVRRLPAVLFPPPSPDADSLIRMLYIGEGDTDVPLPKTSNLVVCDDDRCQDIIDYISSISTPLRQGEVLIKQACYLPHLSAGDGPLIGETGIKGLWMATGNTCWGIQNSCATAKLMSEFIFEGQAKSARIETLNPRRFL